MPRAREKRRYSQSIRQRSETKDSPRKSISKIKPNHRKQTTTVTPLASHGFSFASFFWSSDEGGQTNSSFCSTGDSSSSCDAHANPWKSPVTLLTWQETDPNGNAGRTNVLKIDQEANEKPHLCALSQALGTRNQMGQNKKHTRTHTQRNT